MLLGLLSSNVGVNHISGVIRDVLKLVNVSAEPLPSSSLLKQMIVEGRAVSLVQIGEAARHNNNTLHYDGTTKFGRKYGSFQLSTEDEQLTISVNDVFSGAAEHTLELLCTCVDQVTEVCSRVGSSSTGQRLVAQRPIERQRTQSSIVFCKAIGRRFCLLFNRSGRRSAKNSARHSSE